MSSFAELINRIAMGKAALVSEAAAGRATIDVARLLDHRDKEQTEELDWRRSIVDLMKLLELDTSYGSRKELALELGYKQIDIDRNGSAEMNIWLHQQVMKKLAENGGELPEELLG